MNYNKKSQPWLRNGPAAGPTLFFAFAFDIGAMVGTASFKKVAHFLRPWHWGSIAVISLSAACVLLRRNPKPMSARVEGWRLSRSELREVLKKYEKLVASPAAV